jgi:hypothetical protein
MCEFIETDPVIEQRRKSVKDKLASALIAILIDIKVPLQSHSIFLCSNSMRLLRFCSSQFSSKNIVFSELLRNRIKNVTRILNEILVLRNKKQMIRNNSKEVFIL